ncbi:MAG: IS110 family transposase [Candidatus Dependentiae bacterium]|nr:IS110 family transposase [Candidatus Dependentiae bacterium]
MDNLTKVYVGVDVSMATLDVYIRPMNKALRIENSDKGAKYLNKYLSKFNVQVVACESSGGYENRMLRMMSGNGFHIQHIDPRRIKGFAISEGIKSKTDATDAKLIAAYAEQKHTTMSIRKVMPTAAQQQLRELNKRRKQLIKSATMEKNRLKHPESVYTKKSIEAALKFLEKEIEKIIKDIKDLIAQDDEWQHKAKLIMSVPGVGECTAIELLASLPELGLIGNKQITSLAGLAPFSRESGAWKGKSFIRDGRSGPRTLLYMAALTASCHNQKIKIFYDKLITAGKMPKVTLVAVMRKLIVIINTMLRKGEMWNPAL